MRGKIHRLWEELPMEMRPGVRYWHPAAAMDEEDLRQEIRLLAARGFGKIEAVVLVSVCLRLRRTRSGGQGNGSE